MEYMEFLILITFYFIIGLLASLVYYICKCKQFVKEVKMNKYLSWNKFSDREDISLCSVVVAIAWIIFVPSVFISKVIDIVAKSIRKYFNIED